MARPALCCCRLALLLCRSQPAAVVTYSLIVALLRTGKIWAGAKDQPTAQLEYADSQPAHQGLPIYRKSQPEFWIGGQHSQCLQIFGSEAGCGSYVKILRSLGALGL